MKLPWMSGYDHFFLQILWLSEKSIFLLSFETLTHLENYFSKSEVLVVILRTCFRKVPVCAILPKFICTKNNGTRKTQIFNFLTIFFLKLPLQTSDFGFKLKIGYGRVPLHKWITPIIFQKK